MRSPRLLCYSGVLAALLAVSPAIAKVRRIPWPSVQGLFPGPKPKQWTLAPEDLAPWKPQAAADGAFSGVGFGDDKAWKYQGQPATVVVVQTPLALACRQGPIGLVVGVLDSETKLIARSAELLPEGSYLVDVNATEKPYRIDTAPYRISDTETAFGVRIVHFGGGKHWCYADQVLHLFRVVGKDVVRILTADAFYEQLDQIELAEQETEEALDQIVNNPECSFSYEAPFPPKGRAAVFRMLSSQAKGFYDIQRTQKGGPTVNFRWDGQRYVMEGKDPIDHHVREEWDWCTGRRYLKDHGLPMPEPPKAALPEPKRSPPPAAAPSKR